MVEQSDSSTGLYAKFGRTELAPQPNVYDDFTQIHASTRESAAPENLPNNYVYKMFLITICTQKIGDKAERNSPNSKPHY